MSPQDLSDLDTLTADAVMGRAMGALFFLGFGAVWMFVGLKQTHHATHAALLLLAVTSLLLLLLTARLMHRARELPPGRATPDETARTQRMFNAVNIIQWVSVATAILILNVLHMPQYIVPSIALIVGLHLFPLAGAFHYVQHYVTGSLLVVWPLWCLLAVPQGRISGVCALGVATVLLGSAAVTLLRSFVSVRSGHPAAIAA